MIASISEIESAQGLIVSRIGAPVTLPAVVQIKIATREGVPLGRVRTRRGRFSFRIRPFPSLLNQSALGPSVLLGVLIHDLETRARLMVDLSSKWQVS